MEMKSRLNNSILKMMFLVLTSFLIASCNKDTEEPKIVITVTTASISQITQTSAKSGGSISITGDAVIDGKGICWSITQNPTITDSKTADGTGGSSYTSSLTGLTPSTTYYVRAYATYSEGVIYGNELTFTTGVVVLPTVSTSSITNITQTTATVGGNVTSDGGATVTERGVCYSTTQNPTVDNSKVQIGSGIGTFTSNITGLTTNTTYYVRAYAKNSVGVNYGSQMSFKTPDAPSISSNAANVTYLLVTLSGLVNANGSNTTVKFEYGTTTNYGTTIILGNTISGNTPTNVSVVINNLEPNQKYYYRIVATNSVGTTVSESNFTTSAYKIGDEYLGGIIAYIDATQKHGLIIAKTDQGTAAWSNNNNSIETLHTFGSGKSNTDNIIANQGDGNYAAKLCRNLGSDWFLPSFVESQYIWFNRLSLNMSGWYWSSTQYDADEAHTVDFSGTDWGWSILIRTKDRTDKKVRAVRYF